MFSQNIKLLNLKYRHLLKQISNSTYFQVFNCTCQKLTLKDKDGVKISGDSYSPATSPPALPSHAPSPSILSHLCHLPGTQPPLPNLSSVQALPTPYIQLMVHCRSSGTKDTALTGS